MDYVHTGAAEVILNWGQSLYKIFEKTFFGKNQLVKSEMGRGICPLAPSPQSAAPVYTLNDVLQMDFVAAFFNEGLRSPNHKHVLVLL